MTKITNIGKKIVNIGTELVMPDDFVRVPDAIGEAPAIKALAKMNFLRIEKEAEEKKAPEKSATPDAPAASATNENLESLKKDELIAICEGRGIPVEDGDTKAVLISKINEASAQ